MDDNAGADLDAGDTVTPAPEQSLSMKDGDTFVVFDPWGDLRGGADGFFCDDTRILSRWRLLVGGRRPSKLSFGLSRDNAAFTFNGANLALPPVGGRATPRGVIHLERKRCLYHGRLFERVRLTNFGLDELMLPIAFEYGADFRDMFEVRGMRREMRGVLTTPRLTGRGVVFGYDGLDGVHRAGAVTFSQPPWRLTDERADFMFALTPGDQLDLYVEAGPIEAAPPTRERFTQAKIGASRGLREARDRGAALSAADGAFNAWLDQSRADVALLTTNLSTGPYPYAGIPWFSTPFGRDGIICAWQMLWLDPSLAKGVLSYLASKQATERSDFADAAPGKIMHETRGGEMAVLKEVPFGLYYGGVDTTPLFVALAGAYLKRTGDLALIRRLWPALVAAVRWLENDGDSNGDGLLDYQRGAQSGLANQGWKDSLDSVFHDDGRFAGGPVALVEVQGYAFAAWRAMAFMAQQLGEPGAIAWAARSYTIQEAVENRYWMEEHDFYALAIDGESEVCGPLASNAGHLLFVGLPGAERAAKVTQHLLSPKFDSGWGIRTLAVGAARFNPMSYHNGSVWPHDTALAVFGMAQYGERAGPAKILWDMFQVSKTFDMRMPELLCGFVRKANEPPVAYPVACMPQAWAAGSTFMMLQACLGLTIDALHREVRLVRPTLPDGVDQISLTGLTVAGATVDIDFQRMGGRIAAIPRLGGGPSVAVVIDG
jgi:glycogen debranching enzyme